MEDTIKFYANYNSEQKKYYISGKNEKNKWFSLWKNPDINKELYLDTNKFKKGIEIEKRKLKLLEREDGEESKVLMFKNEADELEYCISKEEIEKRKKNKQEINNSYAEFVIDLFINLFDANKELKIGDFLEQQIAQFRKKQPDELEEIKDDDLPF